MTQTNPLADTMDQLGEKRAEAMLLAGDAFAVTRDAGPYNTYPLDDLEQLEKELATGACTIVNAFLIAGHRDSLWLYLLGAEAINGVAL